MIIYATPFFVMVNLAASVVDVLLIVLPSIVASMVLLAASKVVKATIGDAEYDITVKYDDATDVITEVKKVDKAAAGNLLHKNNAAHKKSAFTKKLNAMA